MKEHFSHKGADIMLLSSAAACFHFRQQRDKSAVHKKASVISFENMLIWALAQKPKRLPHNRTLIIRPLPAAS